jgi:ubiquinone/menaquinone biosynthesis C-methylase UbiE
MTKRRDSQARFRERYRAPLAEAALLAERKAIGANVGANGYTTVAQADSLIQHLRLTPGALLLDIGCGRGWPGLYLSEQSGCRAVLSDLPDTGLQSALQRSDDQALSTRVGVLRASATHLPFAAATFDAISHTDTL